MSDKAAGPSLISEREAADLIGKHILVGFTDVDADQRPRRQQQIHGIVVRVSHNEGIVLRRPDGSEYNLPPSMDGFHEAPAGEYRLRSTGEIVCDPDYVVTYTRTQHQ